MLLRTMRDMDVYAIRHMNLHILIARHGRADVAARLGYADRNYFNQIAGRHLNIGSAVARKIDKAFAFEPGTVDRIDGLMPTGELSASQLAILPDDALFSLRSALDLEVARRLTAARKSKK